MASKIWLSLCLVLFAYNLISLISECYSVSYKIVEKGNTFFDEDNNTIFLFCTPFSNIKKEDSLNYVPEIRNVSVKSFLNYSIASIEQRLNVTNLFNLNGSYIFNNHVCFSKVKSELEKDGKPFNNFLEIYAIFTIFINSKARLPYFYENAYHKNDRLPSVYFKAYKQKIFNRNYLQYPDCSNRENQINYNRGKCLNKCFIMLKTKSSFYDFNDNEFFDLDEILKSKLSGTKQNVEYQFLDIRKNFEYCHKKCKATDCFWEVVTTVKTPIGYFQEKVALFTKTRSAFYSTDDYYLQLFGLLTLFTGTSIVKLLPSLMSLSVKNFKRHHFKYYKFLRFFRLIHPKIRFTITFIGFIFVLNQGLSMVNEFNIKSNYPNMTSSSNFISEPFSLVVCFPIEIAFSGDEEIKEGRNSDILKEHDFKSIKKRSRDLFLSKNLSVQVVSGSELIKTKYNVSKGFLFKNSTFENRTCLSRCFRIDFEMDAIRYKTMIPLVFLNFSLDVKYKELLFIDKSRNFTSGLVNYNGMFNHQKIIKKLSEKSKKSNCTDYSTEQGCDSKRNCIDRCLSIEFIKKHGSLPMNNVLNATHLPSFVLNSGIKFSETTDWSIEEKCSNQFNQPDCKEIYFEESHELVLSEVRNYSLIRLTYLNQTEKEVQYELAKTFLDIVSQSSIFFGLNARGALATLFFVICQTFRLKLHKVYNVIIFLMAGIGFLTHNYLMFNSIIRSDLNENEFFEKPELYTMPSPVFCFFFSKKKIDENHRFTGEYLDDLTKDLTFKHVFNKVIYYDRTCTKTLNISELNSTKSYNFYSDSDLRLTHFYYSNLKCFKINLEVHYKEEDLYFLDDKNVLKIYLKREFTLTHNQTYFFPNNSTLMKLVADIYMKLEATNIIKYSTTVIKSNLNYLKS